MGTYRFRLNNYHAVEKADIAIDGITVLSGVNGAGKSTLSRWLYYIVNGAQRFDGFVYKKFVKSLLYVCRRYDRVRREIPYDDEENISITSNEKKQLPSPQMFARVELRNLDDETAADRTVDYYNHFVEMMADSLEKMISSGEPIASKIRLMHYLDIDEFDNVESSDALQVKNCFRGKCDQFLTIAISDMHRDLKTRPFSLLVESVKDYYEEDEAAPEDVSIEEDGVSLLKEGRLAMLLGLRRAIYIDTPLALGNNGIDNPFWSELQSYINDKSAELEIEGNKLLRRIKDILHGEARFVKTDSPFDGGELHYLSSDNSIEINIEDTATGFKTFIYLQRLLENGYLDNETLLLIDEPEAHLHPQWVVEYARILVLLSKRLGVKVMVASHNPDMVAAIQSIAEREQMEDKVHFYIAEPNGDGGKYQYKDLGIEISEIFKSFNIALSRIETYGAGSIR